MQSNNTFVANNSAVQLDVMTQPGATVAVDSDGDGQFTEFVTTADPSGMASLTVNLDNAGANPINVQTTNDVSPPVTEQIDVHRAEGTVVRFDTSLGTWDVELFDADAPSTVAAFLQDLSRYDDSIVHRNRG